MFFYRSKNLLRCLALLICFYVGPAAWITPFERAGQAYAVSIEDQNKFLENLEKNTADTTIHWVDQNGRTKTARLGRLLGKGGEGRVFEAADDTTNRRFAVKVIAPKDVEKQKASPVMDLMQHSQYKGAKHLLVCEPLGQAEILGPGGMRFSVMAIASDVVVPLNDTAIFGIKSDLARETMLVDLIRTVRRVAEEASIGLVELHSAGFVHLDIKRANLGFAGDKDAINNGVAVRLKILDQNSAVSLDKEPPRNSPGSFGHFAPEVVDRANRGTPVNLALADWYSLGITLFSLLSGETPFEHSLRKQKVDVGAIDPFKLLVKYVVEVVKPESFSRCRTDMELFFLDLEDRAKRSNARQLAADVEFLRDYVMNLTEQRPSVRMAYLEGIFPEYAESIKPYNVPDPPFGTPYRGCEAMRASHPEISEMTHTALAM